MGMVYYMGDQAVAQGFGWSAGAGIMVAVTFLGCFIYDALWKTGLANNLRAATIVSFLLLSVVVALFVYLAHFSYRGVLIHTGTLFRTTMAFNVCFRICPNHQKIIRSLKTAV